MASRVPPGARGVELGPPGLDVVEPSLQLVREREDLRMRARKSRVGSWLRGLTQQRVAAKVGELLARTPRVLSTVHSELPADFPGHVGDSILSGLENSARLLSA